MWQRRYGFPAPLRDAFGDRVYPPDQVARLKLIKQLLSEGWRAGAVVPLADIGAAVDAGPDRRRAGAAARRDRDRRASCSRSTASASCRTTCRSCWSGQGLRKFLEHTLIPLNEAVHERVVRGEMQNFQELRFADLAQRLLRDVTRLVRPTRDARQILLATPPNDPEPARPRDPRAAAVHRRRQLPDARRRRAGAGDRRRRRRRTRSRLVVLLFDRGISGKIAGQEIRGLRAALPPDLPLRGQRPRRQPAREADRRASAPPPTSAR